MKVKVWKILGLLSIMFFVLSAANSVHAVGVTSTINVGTTPYGIAYDSGKGEIFAANYDPWNSAVFVISDSTNSLVTTVEVGGNIRGSNGLWGVAYDYGMGEVFVSHFRRRHGLSHIRFLGTPASPSPTAPTSSSPTATATPSATSTPSASPKVPEFHQLVGIALVVSLIVILPAVIIAKKNLERPTWLELLRNNLFLT